MRTHEYNINVLGYTKKIITQVRILLFIIPIIIGN